MKTMMTERETKQTAMAVVIAIVLGAIIVLIAILFFSKPAHGEESKVISGSFVIGGYEPKKFAVDLTKRELTDACFQGIKADSPKMGEYNLKVLVIGSADTTGVSAENDPLSKNRAEPVAALLRYYLPQGTQVEVVPRGDSENARQVRVEWKYVPAPLKPATAPIVVEKTTVVEKEIKSPPYVAFGLFFAAIIFILLVSGIKIGKRKKVVKLETAEPTTQTQWFDEWLEVGGHRVKIEVKGKFRRSPFYNKGGTQIIRDSKKGIVDSLKGCLKGTEFESQKQELIKKGVIV